MQYSFSQLQALPGKYPQGSPSHWGCLLQPPNQYNRSRCRDQALWEDSLTPDHIEWQGLLLRRYHPAELTPWGSRKGLEDFLELHRHISSDEYQIVLIGLSEDQIKRLPKGIIGLARTESVDALAQWYSVADVFVNPTYEDTYPTTNLEAISCGTPVLTYKTGGSTESVTSETGRVVDKGDIAELAKAIESLCAEDREHLRKRCREYAVAHFDKQECFEKYIELYERILNKK